jgi:hypothetical protein
MTKEEIIQMAKNSGIDFYVLVKNRHIFVNHLEEFAKLLTEKEREREEITLYYTQVLVQQTMEKMIEGCSNVKSEAGLHKDAKVLATEIIKDCNTLLMFIKKYKND